MSYTLHNPLNSVPPVGSSGVEGGHLLPSGFTGIQFEFFLFFVVLFRSMRACVPWGDCQERRGGIELFLDDETTICTSAYTHGTHGQQVPKTHFQIFIYQHLLKHVRSIIFFKKNYFFLLNDYGTLFELRQQQLCLTVPRSKWIRFQFPTQL